MHEVNFANMLNLLFCKALRRLRCSAMGTKGCLSTAADPTTPRRMLNVFCTVSWQTEYSLKSLPSLLSTPWPPTFASVTGPTSYFPEIIRLVYKPLVLPFLSRPLYYKQWGNGAVIALSVWKAMEVSDEWMELCLD